jgi:hypothetical protein
MRSSIKTLKGQLFARIVSPCREISTIGKPSKGGVATLPLCFHIKNLTFLKKYDKIYIEIK